MPLIVWREGLNLGVEEIDSDHKKIVDYVNQFHEAVQTATGRKAARHILLNMIDYTEVHFVREEALMKACGYPDLEAHQAEHSKLTQTVADLAKDFISEARDDFDEAISHFLADWLTGHIIKSDLRIKKFIGGRKYWLEPTPELRKPRWTGGAA